MYDHIFHNLGIIYQGRKVVVTLRDNSANVMLLNHLEYQKYRSGSGSYRYYGGYKERSPVVLPVPSTSHWCVVVDRGGYGGKISSDVQVI